MQKTVITKLDSLLRDHVDISKELETFLANCSNEDLIHLTNFKCLKTNEPFLFNVIKKIPIPLIIELLVKIKSASPKAFLRFITTVTADNETLLHLIHNQDILNFLEQQMGEDTYADFLIKESTDKVVPIKIIMKTQPATSILRNIYKTDIDFICSHAHELDTLLNINPQLFEKEKSDFISLDSHTLDVQDRKITRATIKAAIGIRCWVYYLVITEPDFRPYPSVENIEFCDFSYLEMATKLILEQFSSLPIGSDKSTHIFEQEAEHFVSSLNSIYSPKKNNLTLLEGILGNLVIEAVQTHIYEIVALTLPAIPASCFSSNKNKFLYCLLFNFLMNKDELEIVSFCYNMLFHSEREKVLINGKEKVFYPNTGEGLSRFFESLGEERANALIKHILEILNLVIPDKFVTEKIVSWLASITCYADDKTAQEGLNLLNKYPQLDGSFIRAKVLYRLSRKDKSVSLSKIFATAIEHFCDPKNGYQNKEAENLLIQMAKEDMPVATVILYCGYLQDRSKSDYEKEMIASDFMQYIVTHNDLIERTEHTTTLFLKLAELFLTGIKRQQIPDEKEDLSLILQPNIVKAIKYLVIAARYGDETALKILDKLATPESPINVALILAELIQTHQIVPIPDQSKMIELIFRDQRWQPSHQKLLSELYSKETFREQLSTEQHDFMFQYIMQNNFLLATHVTNEGAFYALKWLRQYRHVCDKRDIKIDSKILSSVFEKAKSKMCEFEESGLAFIIDNHCKHLTYLDPSLKEVLLQNDRSAIYLFPFRQLLQPTEVTELVDRFINSQKVQLNILIDIMIERPDLMDRILQNINVLHSIPRRVNTLLAKKRLNTQEREFITKILGLPQFAADQNFIATTANKALVEFHQKAILLIIDKHIEAMAQKQTGNSNMTLFFSPNDLNDQPCFIELKLSRTKLSAAKNLSELKSLLEEIIKFFSGSENKIIVSNELANNLKEQLSMLVNLKLEANDSIVIGNIS